MFCYFVNGTHNGITVGSKFAGPAGPPSVNFKRPQAILQAIGPRAHPIWTPASLHIDIYAPKHGKHLAGTKLQLSVSQIDFYRVDNIYLI